MVTRISTAADTARLNGAANAVVDLLDGGYLEVRTGGQPATVGTVASGTLLATLPLSATAFGAASGGVATANTITGAVAVAGDGTTTMAGWFRAYTSGDVAVIDGDVSTVAAGTGDMELDDTAIVQGGTVSVTAWTYTQPAA